MMNGNCRSCRLELARNPLCWCGFDNSQNLQTHITANEEFVYTNTKTSHKRYESMVVYALHYALRDLELRSQFHVRVGENDYSLIDLYAPALKLAIEVDEPYHEGPDQKEKDLEREQLIKKTLNCDFVRINCRESIYDQVDEIVSQAKKKGYSPWRYERPNHNERSGEYSKVHWERLEASGVIPEVDQLKDKCISEFGFIVSDNPISRLLKNYQPNSLILLE